MKRKINTLFIVLIGFVIRVSVYQLIEIFSNKILNNETPKVLKISNFSVPTHLKIPKTEFPQFAKARPQQIIYFGDYADVSEDGLNIMKPGASGISENKKIDGTTIFRIKINVDQYSHRFDAKFASKAENKEKHVIFLGCSYVWGGGIENAETLSEQLTSLSSKYAGYNLGASGVGPNDLLRNIEEGNWLNGIPQTNGLALYVLLENHVQIAIGTMSSVAESGKESAAYKENTDGDLQYQGTFQEAHPLRSWLMTQLWRIDFTHTFNLDWPPLSEKHFDFFAKIIKKIEFRYQQKFGTQNPFYVVLYPEKNKFKEKYIKAFEKYGIHYLDYTSTPIEYWSSELLRIDYDGRPNAQANKLMVKQIMNDLKLE